MRMDPELILPNRDLSLNEGALRVTGWNSGADGSIFNMYLAAMAERYGFSLDVPVKDLPREALDALLYGTKGEKLSLHYERDGRTTTYSAPLRASSRAWSAATGRRTPPACARSTRPTCPTSPARTAAASA